MKLSAYEGMSDLTTLKKIRLEKLLSSMWPFHMEPELAWTNSLVQRVRLGSLCQNG